MKKTIALFIAIGTMLLSSCALLNFGDKNALKDHISVKYYTKNDFAIISCEGSLFVAFNDDVGFIKKNYYSNVRLAPAIKTVYLKYSSGNTYTEDIVFPNIKIEPNEKYRARYTLKNQGIVAWLENSKNEVVAGKRPENISAAPTKATVY